MEVKTWMVVVGYVVLAAVVRVGVLWQTKGPLVVRDIDLYFRLSFAARDKPMLLMENSLYESEQAKRNPYYLYFQFGVYFTNEALGFYNLVSMEHIQYFVQLLLALAADTVFLYLVIRLFDRKYLLLALYWTNPLVLVDMSYPHPLSLSAATFLLFCGMVAANWKGLGPLFAAWAALLDPNSTLPIIAASYFLSQKKKYYFLFYCLLLVFIGVHCSCFLHSIEKWDNPPVLLSSLWNCYKTSLVEKRILPVLTTVADMKFSLFSKLPLLFMMLGKVNTRKALETIGLISVVVLNIASAFTVFRNTPISRPDFSIKSLIGVRNQYKIAIVGMYYRCGKFYPMPEQYDTQILQMPNNCLAVADEYRNEIEAVTAMTQYDKSHNITEQAHFMIASSHIFDPNFKDVRLRVEKHFDSTENTTITEYNDKGMMVKRRVCVFKRKHKDSPNPLHYQSLQSLVH